MPRSSLGRRRARDRTEGREREGKERKRGKMEKINGKEIIVEKSRWENKGKE